MIIKNFHLIVLVTLTMILSTYSQASTELAHDSKSSSINSKKIVNSDSKLSFKASGEIRLRFNSFQNGFLSNGKDYKEGLNRNIIGFQLKYNTMFESYVEFANGQVINSNVSESFANYDNKVTLQQAYLKANFTVGEGSLNTQFGRIEFADAPKQLMSPGDVPNIRKSWNGGVVEYKQDSYSLQGFSLDLSKPNTGWFDETRDKSKSMNGILAKYRLMQGQDSSTHINPLYIESKDLSFKVNGVMGEDHRKTYGVVLQNTRQNFKSDWLIVKQTGSFNGRSVDAWAVLAQNIYAIPKTSWEPKITARIDLASGGRSSGNGEINTFNQLHASSGYLGQGLFLSTANLAMFTPGFIFKPSESTQVSIDYAFARRLDENEFAYSGQMRPYAGTDSVTGKDIGQLVRVYAEWANQNNWKISFGYENFKPGQVLRDTHFGLSSVLFAGVTYRY